MTPTENPLDKTDWEPPDNAAEEINPRVVAAPEQVRELLTATTYVGARRGERLTAFFACLYFGMLRPSEAAALRQDDCYLPASGWAASRSGIPLQRPGSSGLTPAKLTSTVA